MDDWKTTFGAPPIFSCYVSFGEGPILQTGGHLHFRPLYCEKAILSNTHEISLLFQFRNIFECNLMVNHHGKPHHFHSHWFTFQQIQANFTFRNVLDPPLFFHLFTRCPKIFQNTQGLSVENPGEYPVVPFTSMTRWPWMSRGFFSMILAQTKVGKPTIVIINGVISPTINGPCEYG